MLFDNLAKGHPPRECLLSCFQTSKLCGVASLVQFLRFSPAATCVLYNGQMCIQPNMAEPTSVIFSPWKIKNCPWKVPRKPGWIFETNLGTLKEFMDLLEQHSCTCATVQNTFPQFDSMKLMQLSITNSEKCTGNHPVNLYKTLMVLISFHFGEAVCDKFINFEVTSVRDNIVKGFIQVSFGSRLCLQVVLAIRLISF